MHSDDLCYDIIKQNGQYLGIIMSSQGIVSNTIPYESKKFVEKSLSNAFQKLKINGIDALSRKDIDTKVVNLIFDLDQSPIKYWENSLKIAIDYQLYSEKQKKVVKTLRQTVPGQVISYGELATKSGIINGARFVGNCMSNNYIPLIIPCHRVIKAGGKLGNYSSSDQNGKTRKMDYLRKENALQFFKK